jgi:hypothetical protein
VLFCVAHCFRVVVENSHVINHNAIGENKKRNAKFEVLTAVLLKVHVLWDVTSLYSVRISRYFEA